MLKRWQAITKADTDQDPWCKIVLQGLNSLWPSDAKWRPGPCLTTAIWRCRKNSSHWQCSFQWKLRSHWLKFLRQRHVAVVKQGPGSWVNISSGINGLLLSSTRPLLEPMLTYHQRCYVSLTSDLFHMHKVWKISICKMSLKTILLKLLPHFSGASELTSQSSCYTYTCKKHILLYIQWNPVCNILPNI